MMHGSSHKNRNNNNRRFSKNSNFKKRRFGSGGGGGSHFEDEQISPQQRRNFENKRDQHLMKAKEYLAAGERVEAENHFQHADHYHRMASIGLDKLQQQQQQAQQNYNQQQEQTEQGEGFSEAPDNEPPYADIPEIPVDMMGRFPSEENTEQRSESQQHRGDRNRGQQHGRRHNNRENRGPRPQQTSNAEAPQEGDKNNLAALPFMQVPIKES